MPKLTKLADRFRTGPNDDACRLPARGPDGLTNSRTSGHLAICAIMKNEAHNLIEWIAYHRLMGVERFFLYDNNSTDATKELLAPLVAAGIVDYTFWPLKAGQLQAYEDFAAKHAKSWTWCAFIDLDEFIHIFDRDSIPEWLVRFENTSGVALQWMNFGPCGHELPPEGLTIASYLLRLVDLNPVHGHVKTILKMSDYHSVINPHSFRVSGTVVDEYSAPVHQIPGEDYAIQPVAQHQEACINHYYTKSRLDWMIKVARGNADGGLSERHLLWFDLYMRDARTFDDRLARKAQAVSAEMERLQRLVLQPA